MPRKKKQPGPKKGDLRVWWIPQIPMEPFTVRVKNMEQAVLIFETLADYDKFQLDHYIKPDYCSTGGVQVFEKGDWEDWYDEDGNDFAEWRRGPRVVMES